MDFDPDHIPVLHAEVLELLAPRAGETLIDCTAGLGGHAGAIAARLGPSGRVVLFDLDPNNLRRAEARVRAALNPADPASARVDAVRANFVQAPAWADRHGVRADMLLADLGFASTQVDDPERGLSFRKPGPLDMRLDPDAPISAAELVNTLPERELGDLIARFGEERHARRIAAKLAAERREAPITTTDRLASIVRSVVPRTPGSIDGATRTFQALRIATNDEIGALEALLGSIERVTTRPTGEQGWLVPGARVGIISFHSLEDRPVKRAFTALTQSGHAEPVTRRPVVPTEDEQRRNPRSRSAKLRVIRLVGGDAGATD
ncbi:MAG: 16S rRNA (cytosine(1402)-N(4))-methyltransferase RsmH [Planctomycetota bacterium]|nr:MAG: 16S rRNA (cytosine(1402)-N(4))-methyltransferase RsmH [Planctomycetota bacterium]